MTPGSYAQSERLYKLGRSTLAR
ncbi:hypothetical protein P2O52_18525 [Escherichia coli]